MNALDVIFRAERSGKFKGKVTAVFPTEPGTNDPYSFAIYAHVGQHGSGTSPWYWNTRAATEAEYASLLKELLTIYSYDSAQPVALKVKKRFTQKHNQERRNNLRPLTCA